MRTPIFVDESGDLMSFDSPEAASHYLEATDVEEGRYVGFDAAGSPLQFAVRREPHAGRLAVEITETGEAPRELDLAALLRARLAAVGVAVAGGSHDRLVTRAREAFLTR